MVIAIRQMLKKPRKTTREGASDIGAQGNVEERLTEVEPKKADAVPPQTAAIPQIMDVANSH